MLLSSSANVAYINGQAIDKDSLHKKYPAPDGVKRNRYFEILNRNIIAGYADGRGDPELITLPRANNGKVSNILVTGQLYSAGGYTGKSHITTWIYTKSIYNEPRICFRDVHGQPSWGVLLMNFQTSFNEAQKTQAQRNEIALGKFYIGCHNGRYGGYSQQYYRDLKVWYDESE